jgi:rare lipoprotein A
MAINTILSKKALVQLGGAFGLAVGMGSMSMPAAQASESCDVIQQGRASWYGIGDGFHGKKTASGQKFNTYAMTAAHKTLPFGTVVTVEANNGKKVDVTINDRGPFTRGRVIDLSYAAADALGIAKAGVAPVKILDC